MSQFRWSYLSPQGKQHVVGVFHGPRTGHLMIYVNAKIVQVDFKVFKDTSYSFFIDEELCEIVLTKKDGRFHYDFKINKEVDTPLNRHRRQFDKVNRNRIIGLFAGLAVFITMAILFGNYQKEKRAQEEAAKVEEIILNKSTILFGEIYSVVILGDKANVTYSFLFEGNEYLRRNEFDLGDYQDYSNGIPLRKGDEFKIKYFPRNGNSFIQLDQITERQMNNFVLRAAEKEKWFHEELSDSEILCRVNCAYQLKGMDGLADFYFQDKSETENPTHNEITYKRLVRDLPFQQAFIENCTPK